VVGTFATFMRQDGHVRERVYELVERVPDLLVDGRGVEVAEG